MSTTNPAPLPLDRSLGDLVRERPTRARVLERWGLDYCCHGNRTIAAAAKAAGLDPAQVAEDLGAVTDPAGANIDALEPGALIDHIVLAHHTYLKEELPLLAELAVKVRDVHSDRHPELHRVAALTSEIRDDLAPHLAKEERVLFPAIREWLEGERSFPFESIGDPVRMMMLEHARAGALLEDLRAVTDGYSVPADGCTSYRSLYERIAHLEVDTHRHVHLENNVLFPTVTAAEP